MKILTIDPSLPVPIGGDTTIIQGENLATQIEFTVPEDMIDLGIIFKFRPYRHEAVITEPLEVIEGVVSYMITNAVTANAGYLDFEVNGYDESLRLVKTLIYHFTVNCSIDGSGEVMPEAYVPWATVVATQTATAIEKAAEASESATTATTKAGEASGFALSASGSAQTASQKAQEAIDTLANKPDKLYVDTQDGYKADKSYVDAQDALKADKTYVDNQDAALTAQLAEKVNSVNGVIPDVNGNVTITAGIPVQENWIIPTLLNGWTNFDVGTNGTCRYKKDQLGFVHLFGMVKLGTLGNAIFNLPIGYRPSKTHYYPVDSNGIFGRLIINHTTGSVTCNVGSILYVSLYEITFKAEA